MSKWTHPVCDNCYLERSTADESLPEKPVVMSSPEMEECCGCGVETNSGIYIRADPSTMQCAGNHENNEEG